MIAALALACTLSATECRSDDARAIASAIDAATDDDGLRAVLVTYAWYESRWRLEPRPESPDARAGKARGPWQEWLADGLTLDQQAARWLYCVQRAGLASVDSSPRRASHRAQVAATLLERAARH